MNIYSYRVEHDLGLAPNPFFGYCTLAVCKPGIRGAKNLQLGDWVIGTGSVAQGDDRLLIYLMQVEEKLTFQEYWDDPRFVLKKPHIPGSLVQMHGDNFYHQDAASGEWIQEHCTHCQSNGLPSQEHTERDLGGKYVLISQRFFYFGDRRVRIPFEFMGIRAKGIGHTRFDASEELAIGLVNWVLENYSTGIHGDPIGWGTDIRFVSNQLRLF